MSRLTLLDFESLPPGRPRVRQFVLTDTACADISRIVINGADTCTAQDLPDGAWIDGLSLSIRTEIEMIG